MDASEQANKRTHKNIAVILPTLSHSVEHNLVHGLRDALNKQNHNLIALTVGWIEGWQQESNSAALLHELLRFSDLDGIVIYGAGIANRSQANSILKITQHYQNIPVINIGNIVDSHPSVVFDNQKPFEQFVDHLVVDKKLKQIAFVNGPVDNYDAQERRAGFLKGLKKHGLTLNEQFDWPGAFSLGSGSFAVRQYFEEETQLPDAIVCANDLSALGVINELEDMGYSVPEDVMVTGFDDLEYSIVVKVPLTTGRYPIYNMGFVAGEAMNAWLKGSIPDNVLLAESSIVYRQSTGDDGDPRSQIALRDGEERWFYSRDSNSDRLMINRAINRSESAMGALSQIATNIYDVGCRRLYYFQTDLSKGKLDKILVIDGATVHELPKEHSHYEHISIAHVMEEVTTDSIHWIVSPVQVDDKLFGFVLAAVVAEEEDFAEFIASGLAQKSDNLRLSSESDLMRDQMVKSEQMASLGRLVSGLAHEINTPLGISLVASTNLKDEVDKIKKLQADNAMTRSAFDEFLSVCDDTQKVLYSSLKRSADLIASFKKVSVDQHVEDIRRVQLADYIDEVLMSLVPKLKRSQVTLNSDLDRNIELNTIPGAWAQLITNLIMNSLIHGFDDGNKAGDIAVSLKKTKKDVVLTIRDNGVGIPEDALSMIYDPFYTTRRARGGTGLGLNITFNLATQKLMGAISVKSNADPRKGETGTEFRISVPAVGLVE